MLFLLGMIGVVIAAIFVIVMLLQFLWYVILLIFDR